jgi:hypothetical protein
MVITQTVIKLKDNFNKNVTSHGLLGCDVWNVGILPQHYSVSQPRRLQLESSPPQKPEVLTIYFNSL